MGKNNPVGLHDAFGLISGIEIAILANDIADALRHSTPLALGLILGLIQSIQNAQGVQEQWADYGYEYPDGEPPEAEQSIDGEFCVPSFQASRTVIVCDDPWVPGLGAPQILGGYSETQIHSGKKLHVTLLGIHEELRCNQFSCVCECSDEFLWQWECGEPEIIIFSRIQRRLRRTWGQIPTP